MLSYDQIYKALKNSKDEGRALGALVCGYLEDTGVGIYREIDKPDGKALAFLMAQMLGISDQTGMGSLRDSHQPQGNWLHLALGIGLELEKGASSVRSFAYTQFYGNQLNAEDTYEDSDYFKRFPTEHAAMAAFRSCLRASTKKALKLTSGRSTALLKKFVIPN